MKAGFIPAFFILDPFYRGVLIVTIRPEDDFDVWEVSILFTWGVFIVTAGAESLDILGFLLHFPNTSGVLTKAPGVCKIDPS